MKNKFNLKGSLILVLILTLILSTAPLAFAATTDSWVTKASMSSPRKNFQTEIVNGKIYAIGGSNSSNQMLSSVEEYDPAANMWTTKAPMSSPRNNFQTAVVNGKIYAIGGNNNGVLSSVEEYDPTSNTWTTKANMSISRDDFQTSVVNGKIYAIGGLYDSSVEEYDPALNKWTTKASMSTSRAEFQTEVVNGKIYAIGGHSSNTVFLSSVEEYDPTSNIWVIKTPMSVPRAGFQTEVINGKIYALGGNSGKSSLATIEEYDLASDIWTIKASMSVERDYFQTKVINGKIYAINGRNYLPSKTSDLSSAEEYDLSTNKGTAIPSTKYQRSFFQAEKIGVNIYLLGGYNGEGTLSSVEEYTVAQTDPTLTVTASPNKLKVGEQFTTDVAIHNVTNICAEDITITYDTSLFNYVGVDAELGTQINKEDKSTLGTVRFLVSCLGRDNAATGDKGLIKLKFKAKAPGVGKVDITKGRIADNATLEMDVAKKNCGEDTITVEAVKDVNRSGEFTLIDLGIDAWYYGMNAADTDLTRFDADVVVNGKVDDDDLASITQSILANSNYEPNN